MWYFLPITHKITERYEISDTQTAEASRAYFTSEVDSALSLESSEEEINIISVYTKLVFPLHFCFKRTENINRSAAH